jgi:hypothetical protein
VLEMMIKQNTITLTHSSVCDVFFCINCVKNGQILFRYKVLLTAILFSYKWLLFSHTLPFVSRTESMELKCSLEEESYNFRVLLNSLAGPLLFVREREQTRPECKVERGRRSL